MMMVPPDIVRTDVEKDVRTGVGENAGTCVEEDENGPRGRVPDPTAVLDGLGVLDAGLTPLRDGSDTDEVGVVPPTPGPGEVTVIEGAPPPLLVEVWDAPVVLLLDFFFPTVPPATPPATAAMMMMIMTMSMVIFPFVVERKDVLSRTFSRDALASKSASRDREVRLAWGVNFPTLLVS